MGDCAGGAVLKKIAAKSHDATFLITFFRRTSIIPMELDLRAYRGLSAGTLQLLAEGGALMSEPTRQPRRGRRRSLLSSPRRSAVCERSSDSGPAPVTR